MLVFALQPSARLEYILEFIGKEVFIGDTRLTSNRQEFIGYDGPKINYSLSGVSEKEFRIDNTGLLFEKGITARVIDCFECNGNTAFFKNQAGDFPFDIFAAAFYLMSRYEEYLPHVKDKFGRFAYTGSLAYKHSFLRLPLVNTWLIDLKRALLNTYPALQFRERKFTFKPTYDIDIAWSYRNKGWWRNTGGLIRSALQLNLHACLDRILVLCKRKGDPFDSYGWLHNLHKKANLSPVYFFLLAAKQKGNDKNISPCSKDLQALIKEHDLLYTTGIHPSWQSGDDASLPEREINYLAALVGHPVTHSRQHYLRFTLPATFQKMVRLGISNEFSMGYGTVNGFRASVASSFYWYDLEREMATRLLVHPFCFMDATANYEWKLSPAAALEELLQFYNCIKEVNGQMITLWHNNFLGTDKAFEGWREVYGQFVKEIT